MKLLVIAVFDNTVSAFAPPGYYRAAGQAVRGFADEVNRAAPDNQFYNHAADYELHQLGLFNDETGEYIAEPQRLARGVDLQQPKG